MHALLLWGGLFSPEKTEPWVGREGGERAGFSPFLFPLLFWLACEVLWSLLVGWPTFSFFRGGRKWEFWGTLFASPVYTP